MLGTIFTLAQAVAVAGWHAERAGLPRAMLLPCLVATRRGGVREG